MLGAWRTLLRTPTLGGHGHHPRLQKRERGRARGDSAEAARSHSRRQDARAHVLRATASRRTRTRRPHPSCSGQGPSWPRRARAGSRTRAKPPVTVPCCGHPGARTALPRSGSSSQRPFRVGSCVPHRPPPQGPAQLRERHSERRRLPDEVTSSSFGRGRPGREERGLRPLGAAGSPRPDPGDRAAGPERTVLSGAQSRIRSLTARG